MFEEIEGVAARLFGLEPHQLRAIALAAVAVRRRHPGVRVLHVSFKDPTEETSNGSAPSDADKPPLPPNEQEENGP